MNKIASIYELRNVDLVNENSGTEFKKQNVLVVEDIDNNRIILDIKNGNDITNSLMRVRLSKKTKTNLLFRNTLLKSN